MTSGEVFNYISLHKLIPVIRFSKGHNSERILDVLIEAGIKIIEVSLLSYDALDIISSLRRKGIFVGAGTVMSRGSAQASIQSGAYFLVSPHTSEEVIEEAAANNILAIPGCLTPTEVIRACSLLDFKLVKVFPASSLGGLLHIKSLIDIFPDFSFMPTGGINLDNISDYFKLGVFAVGVSSSILPLSLLDSGDYEGIRKLAIAYLAKASLLTPCIRASLD